MTATSKSRLVAVITGYTDALNQSPAIRNLPNGQAQNQQVGKSYSKPEAKAVSLSYPRPVATSIPKADHGNAYREHRKPLQSSRQRNAKPFCVSLRHSTRCQSTSHKKFANATTTPMAHYPQAMTTTSARVGITSFCHWAGQKRGAKQVANRCGFAQAKTSALAQAPVEPRLITFMCSPPAPTSTPKRLIRSSLPSRSSTSATCQQHHSSKPENN